MAFMPVGSPVRRVVGTPSPVQRINPVGGPVAPVRGPFRPRAVISGGGYNPSGLVGPDRVDTGLAMPSAFKKGGKVKKTGWAKVHKGEKIIPAGAAANKMGGKKKKSKKKKKGKK